MLESCWLHIYSDTISPSFIAQRCCFWKNQPKSPSCCFVFTLTNEGLACRVPSMKINLPAFHFAARQFLPNNSSLQDLEKEKTSGLSNHIMLLGRSEAARLSLMLSARRQPALYTLRVLTHNCLQAPPAFEINLLFDCLLISMLGFLLKK